MQIIARCTDCRSRPPLLLLPTGLLLLQLRRRRQQHMVRPGSIRRGGHLRALLAGMWVLHPVGKAGWGHGLRNLPPGHLLGRQGRPLLPLPLQRRLLLLPPLVLLLVLPLDPVLLLLLLGPPLLLPPARMRLPLLLLQRRRQKRLQQCLALPAQKLLHLQQLHDGRCQGELKRPHRRF